MEFILWVISFIISAIPALFLSSPPVEDALGTITAAAFLTGVDYREFMAAEGFYYKYGQSLWYLPVYLCVHDPAIRYKAMLVVNSAMDAFIPVIALRIGNKHLSLDRRIAGFIAVMTGLMPSVLLYCKYTWAEPTLFLAPWVVIFILLELKDIENKHVKISEKKSPRRILSALLAWSSVFAFMAHQRGIVLVMVVIIVLILERVIKGKWLVSPVSYSVNLVLALGLDRLLNLWQREVIYLGTPPKYNTLASFLRPEIYTRLISFEGQAVVGRTALGWLYNCGVSGVGITIAGLVFMTVAIVKTFVPDSKRSGRQDRNVFNPSVVAIREKVLTVSIFGLLLFLGSLILGIVFFFETLYGYWDGTAVERCDHLVFGRYIESSYPILLFMGMYGLGSMKKAQRIRICCVTGALMVILTVFFALRLAPVMEGVNSYVHSLMSMNYVFDTKTVTNTLDVVGNLPDALVISGIISSILLAICGLLEISGNQLTAWIITAGTFIFIYFHSFAEIIYRVDSLKMTSFAIYYMAK